jgi:hypothetical protein
MRAAAYLRSLADLGPRPTGSEAARRAHELLVEVLQEVGLPLTLFMVPRTSPQGGQAPPFAHLVAIAPGTELGDVLLLAAPYTGNWGVARSGSCTRAAHGASGAALLLELARALALDPIAHEVWLVFVDDGADAPGLGSAALYEALHRSGSLPRVRVAVFVDGVGEAELSVPRDLRSHRTFRERFFRAAARLGLEDALSPTARFASLPGGHREFLAAGFRPVVGLIGEPAGERRAPVPDRANSEGLPCSAESLETLGRVVLAAIADLSDLLRSVDAMQAGPNPAGAAGLDATGPGPAAPGSETRSEAP